MKYCSKCGAPMGNHDKKCEFCHPVDMTLKLKRTRKRLKGLVLISTILLLLIGFFPFICITFDGPWFRTSFFRYELYICYALIATGVLSVISYFKESWDFSLFCGLLGPAVALFISYISGGLFDEGVEGLKEWLLLFATYFLPNVVLVISAGRLLALGKEGESDYTLHYRRLQRLTVNDEESMV